MKLFPFYQSLQTQDRFLPCKNLWISFTHYDYVKECLKKYLIEG